MTRSERKRLLAEAEELRAAFAAEVCDDSVRLELLSRDSWKGRKGRWFAHYCGGQWSASSPQEALDGLRKLMTSCGVSLL